MPWPRQARPPGCGWRASSTTRNPQACLPRCRGLARLDHRGAAGAPSQPPVCGWSATAMPWPRHARPPGWGWRAASTNADPHAAYRDVVASTGSTTGVRLARLLNTRRPQPGSGPDRAPYVSPMLRPFSIGHLQPRGVVSTSSTTGGWLARLLNERRAQPGSHEAWSRQARPPGAPREGYIREMARRPERVCVPLETEFLSLHREPPGSARLRRELKREQRRETPTRVARVFARLTTAARAVTRRRHA